MFSLNIPQDRCRISRQEAQRKINDSLVAKSEKSPYSLSNDALLSKSPRKKQNTSKLVTNIPVQFWNQDFVDCWHLREGSDSYDEKNSIFFLRDATW